MSPVAPMIVIPQTSNVPYKTPNDFRAVIRVVNMGFMSVVRTDAPWNTMKRALGVRPVESGSTSGWRRGAWLDSSHQREILLRAATVE